jgi:hypothetical protein
MHKKEKNEDKPCLEELCILDRGQVACLEILHGDFRRKNSKIIQKNLHFIQQYNSSICWSLKNPRPKSRSGS